MERKTKVEKTIKRRRVHCLDSKRAVRRALDLRLKNYLLESHPELGV
jgi:hypothetical protein